MKLGKDFFKWFTFAIALIKLLIQIFGDEEDNHNLQANHIEP